MESFRHGDAEIAYLDEGTRRPVVLVHGFASDHSTNWVGPGWIGPLTDAGYRVIAPDMRGHGQSTKFYDEADYGLDALAGDVAALIEHVGEGALPVVGYSMGGRTAATLAALRPDLVSALVLAGVGETMLFEAKARNREIAEALLADKVPDAAHEVARRFRLFADQTGADKRALAACIGPIGASFDEAQLGRIVAPTLVIAGEVDDVSGDPQPLADLIPGAEVEIVPRRDHMRAVGDKVTKEKVLAFLAREAPAG